MKWVITLSYLKGIFQLLNVFIVFTLSHFMLVYFLYQFQRFAMPSYCFAQNNGNSVYFSNDYENTTQTLHDAHIIK